MKIFQTIQKEYAIVGISSSTSNQWTKKPSSFNRKVLVGCLIFGCVVVSQCMYLLHVADGFVEYIDGICLLCAIAIVFTNFMAVAFKKRKLFDSIRNMEKLIDARCKHSKSKEFYLKTNQQIETINEYIFMLQMKVFLQCFMLPKCAVSFFAYFITDSGRDSFELPFPLWFPFDWNKPIGYLIAFILEYIIYGCALFVGSCTLALGIGAYWLIISVTKDIQLILHSMADDKNQATENQSGDLKISFNEFIETHLSVKQFVHDFSNIIQPILMSLFTWSLVSVCGAMLIIQVEFLHHGNVMSLLLNATLNGLLALAVIFISCELGQRMSDTFEEIEVTIDQFDWYLFPIEIQRMLPIVIVNAQQEVLFECFGSIVLTRQAFKNIIHCAYSCFMVLSQLGD